MPAHDEEKLIATTLRGIPAFVDRIYRRRRRLARRDGRSARARSATRASRSSRTSATAASARRSSPATSARIEDGIDVACVMAADNQMDPADLELLALPVARGELDYAKANRLVTGEAWTLIPRTRYLGNAVLSMLTKIASGYWHVADSQSGYTAIVEADARRSSTSTASTRATASRTTCSCT